MYEVSVKTFNGEKVSKPVINRDLAIDYFKAFCQAVDAEEITMIDGLTGEVLYLYTIREGWSVFNGIVLEI